MFGVSNNNATNDERYLIIAFRLSQVFFLERHNQFNHICDMFEFQTRNCTIYLVKFVRRIDFLSDEQLRRRRWKPCSLHFIVYWNR
jgi:hypothetical protein